MNSTFKSMLSGLGLGASLFVLGACTTTAETTPASNLTQLDRETRISISDLATLACKYGQLRAGQIHTEFEVVQKKRDEHELSRHDAAIQSVEARIKELRDVLPTTLPAKFLTAVHEEAYRFGRALWLARIERKVSLGEVLAACVVHARDLYATKAAYFVWDQKGEIPFPALISDDDIVDTLKHQLNEEPQSKLVPSPLKGYWAQTASCAKVPSFGFFDAKLNIEPPRTNAPSEYERLSLPIAQYAKGDDDPETIVVHTREGESFEVSFQDANTIRLVGRNLRNDGICTNIVRHTTLVRCPS